IDTLEDLKAERKRLMFRRLNLEREIRNDFSEIKESLQPVNLIKQGARATLEKNNHVLSNSVGQVTNFLAKTALKNTGFFSRLIVPMIVKTVTTKLVEKNKGKIFNLIGTIATKISGKKAARE
ncbi:MAG: hypothetical protein H0W61_12025, partial [Bacteroidetes bacterium]|nr:hypothetical protein [Bacteroidota bacterium]